MTKPQIPGWTVRGNLYRTEVSTADEALARRLSEHTGGRAIGRAALDALTREMDGKTVAVALSQIEAAVLLAELARREGGS